ncbi:cytochrome C oxidase [Hydrogenophaga sp. Root209]|uniref:c-type cytochrome n=1 Tax=unclassified Hydrogenophaga TaxID=2610897 RepID=UPI0006F6D801|nr:c-type cytochrome [Hydrogenophaga sp. Root209]KRC12036.1 cytochrome C oxidase [Hydrogenophaga sp. Root209]
MAVALALVILALGSVLFHFLSPWYFTPIASNWRAIDTTITITFWVTGFVFVALSLFMAWAVIRYRHRPGSHAEYQPENKKLEWWLLVLTAVGVAAMLAPGLVVWSQVVNVPQEAQVVEAVAQQWHWSYRLPGKDGKLGTTHARYVTDANPFGMNPTDAAGRDDILLTTPELRVPLGKPLKLLLRSKDVLHNFAIAEMRVKMDMVPGMVTYTWFTPIRTGSFDLLCEELCGVGHFAMRGRLVVDEPAAYAAWLEKQPTYAQLRDTPAANATIGKNFYAVCVACHGVNGEGNVALNAPKLAGQSAWYLERQLHLFKSGARGTHEKDTFGKMMAPMAATLADGSAVADVVAYIASLPDTRPASTIKGNADKGRARWATCAACHGAEGRGIAATNAPRLQGMNDWYMATQLKNFRDGVRGAHPQDIYGAQMGLVSGMLRDDAAVGDILAYINTR